VLVLGSVLNRIDPQRRLVVTYDQGREMAQCGRLSEITGVAVCFADQHSPWQRQLKAVADSPAKVIVIA
jgi:IS30 family transposase